MCVCCLGGVVVSGCETTSTSSHMETTVGEDEDMTPSDAQQLLADADALFHARKYAEATAKYEETAIVAEAAGETSTLTEALSQVARGHLTRDLKEEGRVWIERAAALATPSDPPGYARYLGVRGRFEWKDDDKEAATETFISMYDYCIEHELYDRAIDATHMVAITGGDDAKVEWSLKGIEAAKNDGHERWLGPLWNNLGWTYDEQGEYDKALEALLNAREAHWHRGDEFAKLVADWSVGHAYRKVGEYEQAMAWMNSTLAWAQRRYAMDPSASNAEWVGFAHRELGDLATDEGRPADAVRHYREAVPFLEQANMPSWDPEGFQAIKDKATG